MISKINSTINTDYFTIKHGLSYNRNVKPTSLINSL